MKKLKATELTTSEETVEKVCSKQSIEKLAPSFGNGEVNQVVEKLNEIIEVLNKCQ